MARPKRLVHVTASETLTPPDTLQEGQHIARITKSAGNNLYNAILSSGEEVLAEMPAKFRSTIWVRRGTFVVVDMTALGARNNKLDGEIVNIVRDEKIWRKQRYWPAEFSKNEPELDDPESNIGKLPPSSDSENDNS